ncbi:hypothetical protein FOXG_21547 [Fusarium oxysporum f. sp. lycopersici 4287]|uniref:HNH nuclease domain-containing protein n=1 Tax=Fusarium oxysporum f. sp. lycopersici (strain 4287 / CBS 123668 / FGSC 9935 / NRRL 34936) TaxID=426428 RepID=A0A0J9VY97_FUSO4|nr:hypothetical protein FOXG_21547 [Fusarium oxysporum f. sp. lycopersici 4287]KAJ9413670.1 hypothetical protein QL093DRAFT_1109687 [Fusarium oxysporum]KNB15964.1 hypothetical protein FOXG_21547 [Fusarium oxysporum f. sp. lycopersici 4287]
MMRNFLSRRVIVGLIWSPRNGILLMKHLHEFFDVRLFSIHPHTLRTRVFVPYDALTEFNGKRASVHTTIDRKALRHHYDMSCIENMTADRPILDVISPSTSMMTSGKATPLTARTDLPATPTSVSRATEWWAIPLRDSDGTIPTKADKETFRCKVTYYMNRRRQRGWMKEGGNVNDSLTTRFICRISGCSRIRRMNRIFWKLLSRNWKRFKEMVHLMQDWEPRLVNSMVVMIPKQKVDVR